MPVDTDPAWYSTKEAAARLGISKNTLHVWIAEKRGPALYRVGNNIKYRPADIEAFLASKREKNEGVA